MPTLRDIDPGTLARYPSLAGRTVFVTGGGSGIGAAIVKAFAVQQARVAFVDVVEPDSLALVEEIARLGLPRPWFGRCDVRDIAALQQAIAAASGAVGDFAVLVNNVANDDRHAFESVTPEYWDDRMAINQRPAFFASQAVAPGMIRLGGGSIVNVGSVGWQIKIPDFPCYAIAKSSIDGLTRSLAGGLGKHRIRVNTVSPGAVMTERQLRLWVDEAGARRLREVQCLPDLLQAEDVARVVLFLASDDSALCTAQEFRIDAGLS